MQSPKISIIVGCYNVANFLKKGRLNAIYSQTYSNWELILVDDGSTDETGSLLDAEALKDGRITVIHKQNGGLGSARNAGLEIAHGDYIWSFDVDDNIEPDVLEKLSGYIEETNAEVLCFGYVEHDLKYGSQTVCQFERVSCHSNVEVRDIYLDHLLFQFNNGFFWNKLYRRDFLEINHLRFGNERIQQDEVFNLKVYECVSHLELIPGTYYHYYVYNTGNNRSRFIPNRFEIYKSVHTHFCNLKAFWNLEDSRFDSYLYNRLFDNLNVLLRYNLTHPKCPWTRLEIKTEMNRVLNDGDIKHAIAFKQKEGLSIENRLFLYAYCNRSVWLVKILNSLFAMMRMIRHLV